MVVMGWWCPSGWQVGEPGSATPAQDARACRYRIRRPAPIRTPTLGGDRGEVVGGDRIEPVRVAVAAAVQGVLERALDRAGDLARAAAADRVVVDLADRRQLGGGTGAV